VEAAIKSLSDQELVAQAMSGSREAFAEIYIRHKDGVYNYCLRFVKDEDSAKDIVQETFLRMRHSLDGLRDGMALRVWLLSIARNYALNSMRKAQLSDPLVDEPASDDDTPYEAVLRNEQVQTVKSLIESLVPALREVIVLREYEDLSYRDIAQVMGISEANVRVSIYRARKAIAASLKKELRKDRT
jgi:RNA polymerase sigma-70 factor (ECF subfamily)